MSRRDSLISSSVTSVASSLPSTVPSETPPSTNPSNNELNKSPLKRVNTTPSSKLQTKFYASWNALITDSGLFLKEAKDGGGKKERKSERETRKWFEELFCLKVEGKVVRELVSGLGTEVLLGPIRTNITLFFTSSISILKDPLIPKSDIRRSHIVSTLIPFLRHVLSLNWQNYSYDLMILLSGSMERADQVFTDLVSAVDIILADPSFDIELRHRTLQLTLTLVSSLNQTSINAYFLRRDLFSTLTKFMDDPVSSPFAYEGALLLGLLANFRKYEARNPYLVRIEDLVEEGVMERIIEITTSILISSLSSYISITDDSPPSFVASLTSLVFSLMKDWSLSLPEAPKERVSEKKRGKMKAVEKEEGKGGEKAEKVNGVEGGEVGEKTNGTKEVAEKEKEEEKKARKEREEPFKDLPPEVLVILLPFYNLLNSNKVFCGLVFGTSGDEGETLTPSLISLSSYIFCHASVSARAKAYSRLCLILLTILVEEGEGKLTGEKVEVRLCRQRLPMLPQHNEKRPLISAMLDSCVIYLRHNLHKRLDAETFIVCLKLVQRIMQQLKTERVRLDYDWVAMWRAMLLLSAFIVSKMEELRKHTTKMDDLISQIFIVLSYAAYWGETFFPTARTSTLLHYELLHADETLDSLSDLLGITSHSHSSTPTPVDPTTAPTDSKEGKESHLRDTPTRHTFFSVTSPRKQQFSADPNPSFLATECVSNIRSSISYFSTKIDELRKKVAKPDEIEVEQVVRTIEANLNGVDLIDAVAMADLRRYSEHLGQESYFKSLVAVACKDVLAIIPVE